MFDLKTASKEELKSYGRDELGLSLSMNMSEETMRQRILDAHDEQGTAPPSLENLAKPAPGKKNTKIKGWSQIVIPKQDKPGGDEPVFVGYNAKGYTIPRDIETDVPNAIVEILKNAKQDLISQDDSGKLITRVVPTYPYQLLQVY